MAKFKWRVILSMSNLFAAVCQSALGQHQYDVFRRAHLHTDAVVPYIPTAQLISYCINAPSFVFANLLGNLSAWETFWGGRGLGGYWFHVVSPTFYLVLFCFWWWVGWRFDVKPEPDRRKSFVAVLGYLSGAILSLVLVYLGLQVLMPGSVSDHVPGGLPVPLSMVFWGVALFCYFGATLLGSRNRARQIPPVV